jgi:rod shape-determining protein MreD
VAGLVAGAGRREGETPMAWVALVVLTAAGAQTAGRVVVAALSATPVHGGDLALRLGLTAALAVAVVPLLVRAEHALVRRNLA